MSKRKRHDNLDSRLNQRALDLFKLGRAMLARGIAHDSQEINEVAVGIHPRPRLAAMDGVRS